ncbi:auxin-responsive protein SAUR61-like [Neltuma alba]|uniref:auxin-responsive protein SAUR61-like n=1 Tax=Neltuma alba TaxID=207710 RepID=UPI0010A380DB|nr:auxin-responsive protein SAUR61-like [Prosopis alba]
MMSVKQRIIQMARKWQKRAASGRISYPGGRDSSDHDGNGWAANKGHFVVYSTDRKRFVVPIEYLRRKVVKELLRLSEEEFGLARNGPITLPIDGTMLEYVMSLVGERVPEDVEKALISFSTMSTCHALPCSPHHPLLLTRQPTIYGF